MHFFTEHTKLNKQTNDTLAFGPDPNNLEDVYNLTTQFTLKEDSKAFACQSGYIFVTSNSNDPANLVNVILKPDSPTDINGVSVRYYSYRGIKFSSFFNVQNTVVSINQPSDDSSEVINNYWSWREQLANLQPRVIDLPDATPLNSFGYGDSNFIDDISNINLPLNDSTLISDVFFGKTGGGIFYVREGTHIGDFLHSSPNTNQELEIGFDIELEADSNLNNTVSTARSSAITIDVSNISNAISMLRKEFILTYIDPVAFFGLHFKDKVTGVDTKEYLSNGALNNSNKTTPGSLYSDIIDLFKNKNKIYLDIRNEKGLSYNFDGRYTLSNIRLNGALNTESIAYGTNGWPILILEDLLESNSQKKTVTIRLSKSNNTSPVAYFDNDEIRKKFRTSRKPFNLLLKDTDIEGGDEDWTASINLFFPIDGTRVVSNYARIYYFINDATETSTIGFRNLNYYESPFCPINLDGLGSFDNPDTSIKSTNPGYINQPLNNDDGTGNFSYVSEKKVFWNTQKVIFTAKSKFKRTQKIATGDLEDGSAKYYFNTFEKKLPFSHTNQDFRNEFENNIDIICREYQESASESFRIIGLNNYEVGGIFQEKEDLMMLGLTIDELEELKSNTQLSSSFPIYIYLNSDNGNPLLDSSTSHHRYRKYDVQLQGLNNAGNIALVNTNLEVFSRDNQFFVSKNFSSEVSLSEGLHRLEYHIYATGDIKINDNIDLSLLRLNTVVDEHTVQRENADDADDTSLAQSFYYLYHPESTSVPTLIGDFDIVMSDKFRRLAGNGGIINSLPAGFVETITYTSGSAVQSYRNPTTKDIVTRNASNVYRQYVYQGKVVYLLHFVTDATDTDVNRNMVFNANNNTLGLLFKYSGSRRRYSSAILLARVIGALIRDQTDLTSTGFTFGDGTCYPSAEHTYGRALDNSYIKMPSSTWQEDVNFIRALDFFGIDFIRTGMHTTQLNQNLSDENLNLSVLTDTAAFTIAPGVTLHDTHLHLAIRKV